MNTVAQPQVPFPLAEGLGIFFGIAAWDVLSVGTVDLLTAGLLSAGAAGVWYGARCWLAHRRRKRL